MSLIPIGDEVFKSIVSGDRIESQISADEVLRYDVPGNYKLLLSTIAIASVAGGYIGDKRGWRPAFVAGCFMIVLSSFFSAIAWEPVSFIISSTILYVALTIGGLAAFAVMGTISSAIAAVVLLGLSESFGIVTAVNYFVGLRASRELGEGMALGFYGLVEKVGQLLGPIIFGILVIFGYSKGVGILAMSTAFMLLLFIILSGKGEGKVKIMPKRLKNM
jgi:MFS family permease